MTETESLTVHILREIRDELSLTRTELSARIDETNHRLDETNTRMGSMESALVDLAQQQRFVVRHLTALTARDRALESDVEELRARMDAMEKRFPG
jgi:chromosome segregation ATPase